MTMAVFDFSDIKARMERRAPTKPEQESYHHVLLSWSIPSSVEVFDIDPAADYSFVWPPR